MASSGTISLGTSSGDLGRWSASISWTAKQSYSGNYTDITATLTVTNTTVDPNWTVGGCSISGSITIDGDTSSGTRGCSFGASNTILTKTKRVYHWNDGSRSVTISGSGATVGTVALMNYSGSGTAYLNSIPRNGRISDYPTAFTDEDSPVIKYNFYAGTSASAMAIGLSDVDDKAAVPMVWHNLPLDSTGSGKEYTFAFTEEERTVLRKHCSTMNSTTLYLAIRTTIGSNVYYSSKPITFSIINATPIVNGTVVDTNATTIALSGDANTLIRYHSTAKAQMTCEALKDAAISSYYIEYNGIRYPNIIETFTKVESNTFGFSMTDTRGNEGTAFVQAPMIDYVKLTCDYEAENMEADGDMTVKCSGNYYNDTFGYTSAAVMNTLTVQYRYKEQSSSAGYSDWVNMTVSIKNNTYTAQANISGLDYQKAYIFQCRAIDKLTTITSAETTIKSLPIFHWGENDFVFEVPVTFKAGVEGVTAAAAVSEDSLTEGGTINGSLDITGDLRLKGSGNYGNTLFFGDGSYAYIQEPTDDSLKIKASVIDLDGTLRMRGNPVEFGSWYPTLSGNAANSYTANEGWYMRMGNVMTVGFFVKANCASGYQSTNIAIQGLPQTPASTAAGGGMCSGAYVSAGFNFQCWAVGTNGTITARVQACNNTSASNLNTSASGCWYPNGGGEVTLSGTISYLI